MGVGLAFAREHVAVCRARRRGDTIHVASAAVAPLPAGDLVPALAAPNVADPAAFDAALGDALARARVGRGPVAVALPDGALLLRILPEAPRGGTRAEARRVIAWQLRESLGVPAERARVDFAPLDGEAGPALCLAAADAVVSQYEALLARRCLVATRVEAASLALWNLLAVCGALARVDAGPVGVLLAGDGHATLVVAVSGCPRLWRGLAEPVPDAAALAREVGDSFHALVEAGTLGAPPPVLLHAPSSRRDALAAALEREGAGPVHALGWPAGAPADPALLPALGAALAE